MKFNPNSHHRHSIRLRGWDYRRSGLYFVTIVVKNRINSFGRVENYQVDPSHLGRIADVCWNEIPQHHKDVFLDEYIIMPNHIHGIIIIDRSIEIRINNGNTNHSDMHRRDVQLNVPPAKYDFYKNFSNNNKTKFFNNMNSISPTKGSLSVVIRTFKAAVTTYARQNGYYDFAWQQRFHDHIVRNNEDLERIRRYIKENPLRWSSHPD